jgi:hypothetical protein
VLGNGLTASAATNGDPGTAMRDWATVARGFCRNHGPRQFVVAEAAWASLYSTTSCPFDPPTTGRIAIKVINHYGDEVLKVYPVR